MQLIIEKHRLESNDYGFITYLLNEMKEYVLTHLDKDKLEIWTIYLSNKSIFDSKLKKSISALEIITAGVSNLVCRTTPTRYIISIDYNQMAVGLTAKLETFCKLINYGNAEMRGYPIFTAAFKHFDVNLGMYEEMYLESLQ